jgi:hypothetical protein
MNLFALTPVIPAAREYIPFSQVGRYFTGETGK